MHSNSVYVGIDVACALCKRLPLCVVSTGHPLLPHAMPAPLNAVIPRGPGNKEILAAEPFRILARAVADGLAQACKELGWVVKRIAIDAPAAAPESGCRSSEKQLAETGLSSFITPALSAWPQIHEICVNHLRASGKTASLPHANRIWMLYGFELFCALRAKFDCEVIEVYPFAIIRVKAGAIIPH